MAPPPPTKQKKKEKKPTHPGGWGIYEYIAFSLLGNSITKAELALLKQIVY